MNTPSPQQLSKTFYAVLIAPVISFFLGATLMYYLNVPWESASSSGGGMLLDVILGCGFAVFTFAALVGIIRLPIARSLRDIAQKLLPLFQEFNVPQILILSVAAGVGEEVLFRGFLQIYFYDLIGVGPAILLTSVIFGLLHFGSVSYFLLATFISLALGIVYHLTGSLLLVMVWHTTYDLLAFWVVSRYPQIMHLDG